MILDAFKVFNIGWKSTYQIQNNVLLANCFQRLRIVLLQAIKWMQEQDPRV